MKTKDVTRESKCKNLLEVSRSTANTKLHREIIWMLLVETNRTKCYRCNEEMTRETFSIEHKIPWGSSENPKEFFYDLSNIDFSHIVCNIRAPRGRLKPQKHGTLTEYQHYGCRCELCVESRRKHQRDNPRQSRVKRKEEFEKEKEIKHSTHGTVHMYRYRKCRCELCTDAMRQEWKRRKNLNSRSTL